MTAERKEAVRSWSDRDLAKAVESLNARVGRKALYTGSQKAEIRAEVSRRLRFGRLAEENNFHTYHVNVSCQVEATNEQEALDGIEEVMRLASELDMGIVWFYNILGCDT